ncbi:MAG TPA: protein kinase [Ktedonobacteraceae bacterium]|nr:protein kinase [Ktedonobacteraceae bacterium]
MTDGENRVGQQIGDYYLLRLLGKGGFAEVYLGEHVNRKSLAAIKVLHARIAKDNIRGFLNEARSIRLKHPHIIPILDFGLEDDYPYLAMEYAPNGSLRQRHPKGTRLPSETIITYVKQVADALQYAHDEKVVHRDIKPENMLIGKQHDILLADFGIATIAQSTRHQSPQDMAGTITYMAPEQIQGKPRMASDQYSLGIVVYEWIAGKRPFSGSLSELIGQHISTAPPSLLEFVPLLPPAVEEVVMKSLAKDPKERFDRISDFSLALESALRKEPAQPRQSNAVTLRREERLSAHIPVQTEHQPQLPSLSGVYVRSAPQAKRENLADAIAHVEAGRYDNALVVLDDILSHDSSVALAHSCKGLALYHLKRFPEALTALNSAINLNVNDATAHYGKALTLEKMLRYMEALEELAHVTQLQASNGTAWCKKGEILLHLKRYGESLTAYEQALKLDANNADAYIGKGKALKLLGAKLSE